MARLKNIFGFFLLACSGMAGAANTVCEVSYSTRNDWAGGFVLDVRVANSGAAPVSDWKVVLQYGQTVTATSAPWRADVSTSGGTVTAIDNGATPVLAAGASLTFGVPLTYSGSVKPTPSSVTVSGQGCVLPEVFYADPNANAALWVKANPADSRMPAIRDNLAHQAAARWFGNWSGEIGAAVGGYVGSASALKQTPILVAYNIPGRDCGQYSSGGAASTAAYKLWIHAFAAAVGARKAVVILEPDALPQLDCLDAPGQAARLELFQYAVAQFHALAPKAWLYLDAGNSHWLSSSVAASRLIQAGIQNAHGFSLNVSNFSSSDASAVYGDAVKAALKAQQGVERAYVVDTSRNGNGRANDEWCDPAGRKIGTRSVEHLGGQHAEMSLWIKAPGNADGCAAKAGTFSPDLAYKLIYGY